MRPRLPLGLIALSLFVVSLVVPALDVETPQLFTKSLHTETMYGFQCLALGYLVLPAWLANPLWAIGMVLHAARRKKPAISMLLLALIAAVSSPLVLTSMEGYRLVDLHIGYFAWLASIATTLAIGIRGERPQDMLPPT